ncbi:Hypothetical_protein [Hexamita inflata]|uniref:Hypothetical_protein n=1 Tax=Hexamita inflata TaxID=28002 RepID=A0ABP1J4K3_9EUKA
MSLFCLSEYLIALALVISLKLQLYLLTIFQIASFTRAQLQKFHKAGVSVRQSYLWQIGLKQLVQKLLMEVQANSVRQIVFSQDKLQLLAILYAIVEFYVILLLNFASCSFYSSRPSFVSLCTHQFLISFWNQSIFQYQQLSTGIQLQNSSQNRSQSQDIIYILAKCKYSSNLQCLNFLETNCLSLSFSVQNIGVPTFCNKLFELNFAPSNHRVIQMFRII